MQNHLLRFGTLFSCAMLLSTAVVKAADTSTTVLATVNDKTITQQNYNEYVGMSPDITPSVPNQSFVIDDMVNRELVVQAALKQGLDKDSQFRQILEKLKYNALFEFGMEKYYTKHPVTDERLREEYKKFKPLTQYKVRHILVKTQNEATAIIAEIQQGKNFAQLAAQKSMDPMSRPRGGELGWLAKEQMFESVANAAAGMGKGQFTTTPVQSKIGWHVVLLEDTREVPPLPFESARLQLMATIRNQMASEYFAELKKQGEVKINP